jgi:maleate isomerase
MCQRRAPCLALSAPRRHNARMAAAHDRLGFRLKIGIVIPSTNTSVEPECDALRPRGVTNHVARIMVAEQPQRDDAEQAQVIDSIQPDLLPAVDRVMTCAPATVVMGMSLPTFWDGMAASERLKARLEARAGVPVVLGSHACLAALLRLGAPKRLALMSPYQPVGDGHVRRFFEEAGYQVIALDSVGAASMRSIAQVDTARLIDALKGLAALKPDAILQAGTNLAMSDLAAEAERWLGLPVLAINAVTYWQALRANRIGDRVFGYGRLLEEF